MNWKTKTAAVLFALAASVALAACGSGSSDETVSGQFQLVPEAPSGYADLSGEAELERTGGGTEASIQLSGLRPDTDYVAHVHAAGCDQPDPGGPHFKFDPNGSDEPPNEIHFALTSSAGGEGNATASNEEEVPAGEAGSIVLHLAEQEGEAMDHEAMEHGSGGEHGDEHGGHSHADKIACAELEGGSGEEASNGSGEGEATPAATIVVRNGEPVGGVRQLTYSAGDQIEFTVRSDVADEVHVHGYDLMKDVEAGGSVSFSFPAEIEGIFEVELEGAKQQLAEITVNP